MRGAVATAVLCLAVASCAPQSQVTYSDIVATLGEPDRKTAYEDGSYAVYYNKIDPHKIMSSDDYNKYKENNVSNLWRLVQIKYEIALGPNNYCLMATPDVLIVSVSDPRKPSAEADKDSATASIDLRDILNFAMEKLPLFNCSNWGNEDSVKSLKQKSN